MDSILNHVKNDSVVLTNHSDFGSQKDSIITHIIQLNTESTMPVEHEISGWLILIIIGMCMVLYFASSLIKNYIIPIFKTRYKVQVINIIWFRISVLSWAALGLFSTYLLVKASPLITVIFIVLILTLAYHFLIDFFIGIYFKFEHNIRVKDKFIFGDTSGIIKEFNTRHLRIVNSKNEEVLIPYRNLLNNAIVITKQTDNLKSKEIIIDLTGNIAENLNKLTILMKTCPWIYNEKNFSIEHKHGSQYSIIVLAKEAFTFNKVEEFIHEKIK